jgi:hypothetical protein
MRLSVVLFFLTLLSTWIDADELPFRDKIKYHTQMIHDYNHSRMILFNSDILAFNGCTLLSLITKRQDFDISSGAVKFKEKDKVSLQSIRNTIQKNLISDEVIVKSAATGMVSTIFLALLCNKQNSFLGLSLCALIGGAAASSYFIYNRIFQESALMQADLALGLMDSSLRNMVKAQYQPQALIPGYEMQNDITHFVKKKFSGAKNMLRTLKNL